jgi:hypothetical protein
MFIEPLESRTFLSATALSTAEATLKLDITALKTLQKTNAIKIKEDTRGQVVTPPERAFIRKVTADGNKAYTVLLKADTSGAASVNRDAAKLASAERALAHRSTVINQAKAAADISALQSDAAKVLSNLNADSATLQTIDSSNLTTLGTEFSTDANLQSDIASAISNESTAVTVVQTDATTAFSTDVNALIASYTV